MAKRIATLMVSLLLGGAAHAASMRVQVQAGQVRGTPSYLGSVVTTVGYGQSVEVVGAQGAWQQVRTSDGKTGWMHESALTVKRLTAQPGGAAPQTGASGDEMALAGKGFNKDVEAQFKAAHADADFTWVDKMAGMKATPGEIQRFVKDGGLTQPGGAK